MKFPTSVPERQFQGLSGHRDKYTQDPVLCNATLGGALGSGAVVVNLAKAAVLEHSSSWCGDYNHGIFPFLLHKCNFAVMSSDANI